MMSRLFCLAYFAAVYAVSLNPYQCLSVFDVGNTYVIANGQRCVCSETGFTFEFICEEQTLAVRASPLQCLYFSDVGNSYVASDGQLYVCTQYGAMVSFDCMNHPGSFVGGPF